MAVYTLGQDRPQLAPGAWIAPNATVIGKVHLAADASVWWNVVIRGDTDEIFIGEQSNIQDGSVCHTDSGLKLRIGNRVTIGHKVICHGCVIGDDTLIGMGATLLNHCVIGANSLVAANTLIPEGKVYPAGSLIMGSPGKVVRSLTESDIQRIKFAAQHYVDNARRYQQELICE